MTSLWNEKRPIWTTGSTSHPIPSTASSTSLRYSVMFSSSKSGRGGSSIWWSYCSFSLRAGLRMASSSTAGTRIL